MMGKEEFTAETQRAQREEREELGNFLEKVSPRPPSKTLTGGNELSFSYLCVLCVSAVNPLSLPMASLLKEFFNVFG